MNFQRPKKLTKVLFFFVAILISTSCKVQNKTTVVEILTGIEIESDDYNYSDESILKLGNVEYLLRSKAIYDTNGDIQELEIYKSEGNLNYDRSKLIEDISLLEYYGLPFHQKLSYSDGVITKDENDRIDVTAIGDYLINEDDNIVRFYKLK
ncbi:MAG: hypothetical protein GKR88_17145 [Flavobacteriaceae bacterium]|nr:MAG: hypothetical protein GKR88_04445 [Flavobacteriaceae bacterium]QMU65832.1 MAG: hypothetical protein GKR88_17145 [Flavobacteriaceae bacterium]